jgi:hypothetical protein
MHRALLRIVLATISVIAVLFGGATVRTAVAEPVVPSAIPVYDAHPVPGCLTDSADERGPPARTNDHTSLSAVGHQSHGASACPEVASGRSYTTYDKPALLAQVTSAMCTTQEQAQGTGGKSSPFDWFGVAAETTASRATALLGKPGDMVVLGRQPDTALWKGVEGRVILDTPDWSLDLNDAFIRGAIDQRRTIFLASPTKGNLIQTSGQFAGQPTIYARELNMLRDAGYTPSGDYMIPPS